MLSPVNSRSQWLLAKQRSISQVGRSWCRSAGKQFLSLWLKGEQKRERTWVISQEGLGARSCMSDLTPHSFPVLCHVEPSKSRETGICPWAVCPPQREDPILVCHSSFYKVSHWKVNYFMTACWVWVITEAFAFSHLCCITTYVKMTFFPPYFVVYLDLHEKRLYV